MISGIFVITTVDGYGADKSILDNIVFLKSKRLLAPFVIIPKSGPIEQSLKAAEIEYVIAKITSWTKGPRFSKLLVIKRSLKIILNLLSIVLVFFKQYRNLKNKNFVHTNTFTTNYGIILAKILKIKHFMHLREIPFEQFRFEYEFKEEKLYKYVVQNTSAFLANSIYTTNYFRERLIGANISYVPNPIFINSTNRDLKRTEISEVVEFILLGRYEDAKNQMDALEACNILKGRGVTKFQLNLFGSGINYALYKDFIKEKDLNKWVKLNGFNHSIRDRLSSFDVGLMTSRYEAFGRVTVEYFKSGLAVIANETGNSPYLVKDNLNGLIYEFGNPESLSDKMTSLIENRERIVEMGSYAIENSVDEFSIENSSVALELFLNRS